MHILFAQFLYKLFLAKIYGFSSENGPSTGNKSMNTRIFRGTHIKSHFGESEDENPKEILQHLTECFIYMPQDSHN